MLKLPISIISRLGPLVLVVSAAYMGWQHLGPSKPEAGPLRKRIADRVIPCVVEDIRNTRGDISDTVLLHLQGDPTDYITNQLRRFIEHNGVLDLRDRTVAEKAYDLLHLKHRVCDLTEDAVEHARAIGCPAVLFGRVNVFESYPKGARLDMEINLVDVSTNQVVFSRRYAEETGEETALQAAVPSTDGGAATWLHRLLAWVIAALLLPVFTISFIRAMLRKESNAVTIAVLAAYTLADAVLLYVLVGLKWGSIWSLTILAVSTVVAFLYNMRITLLALALERGRPRGSTQRLAPSEDWTLPL